MEEAAYCWSFRWLGLKEPRELINLSCWFWLSHSLWQLLKLATERLWFRQKPVGLRRACGRKLEPGRRRRGFARKIGDWPSIALNSWAKVRTKGEKKRMVLYGNFQRSVATYKASSSALDLTTAPSPLACVFVCIYRYGSFGDVRIAWFVPSPLHIRLWFVEVHVGADGQLCKTPRDW